MNNFKTNLSKTKNGSDISTIHLVSSISKKAGGVQPALINLTNPLFFKKIDLELWSFKENNLDAKVEGFSCKVKLFNSFSFLSFRISPSLPRALKSSRYQILHLHGLWEFPSVATRNWPKNKPLIISPHGMLAPWSLLNSFRKKKIALFLYEKENLQRADCFFALCESEYQSIRALGYRQPVAIIPNGVELPVLKKRLDNSNKSRRTILYLGRIHKVKNLLGLAQAWTSLPEKLKKGWELRIAGWGDNDYKNKLARFVNKNLTLDGPLYGKAKEMALRSASAFILPSFTEGSSMALLEAFSYKLPVLMSRECNFPEGFTFGAALETGTAPSEIAKALEVFLTMSDAQKDKMALNGRKLIENNFSLPIVASNVLATYKWLLGKARQPKCVMLE